MSCKEGLKRFETVPNSLGNQNHWKNHQGIFILPGNSWEVCTKRVAKHHLLQQIKNERLSGGGKQRPAYAIYVEKFGTQYFEKAQQLSNKTNDIWLSCLLFNKANDIWLSSLLSNKANDIWISSPPQETFQVRYSLDVTNWKHSETRCKARVQSLERKKQTWCGIVSWNNSLWQDKTFWTKASGRRISFMVQVRILSAKGVKVQESHLSQRF